MKLEYGKMSILRVLLFLNYHERYSHCFHAMKLKWAKDIIGVEKSNGIVKYRFFKVALQFMNIIALLISLFDF